MTCSIESPLLGLALIIGIIIIALLVMFPLYGLYLTAAVVPLERVGRFTDDTSLFTISLMRVLGMATFLAMFINYLIKRKSFQTGPAFFLYAGYCIFTIISITYTTDYEGTIRQVSPMIGNLLFFFIIINLIKDFRQAEIAVICWLISTVGVCLFSSYDWLFGSGVNGEALQSNVLGEQMTSDKFTTVYLDHAEWQTLGSGGLRRSMGTTSHASVYGINLVMTIPFFLYFFRCTQSAKLMALIAACFILLLYNILLTNTRAVLVVTLVSLLLSAMTGLLQARREYLVLSVIGLALFPFVIPEDIFTRMLNMSNYSLENAAAMRIRIEYWRASLGIFADHWFTGIGIGNRLELPRRLIDPLTPLETNVHNIYIQTALDVGVLGWLLFFSFIAIIYKHASDIVRFLKFDPLHQRELYFAKAAINLMLTVLVFGFQADVFLFPLKGWWLVSGLVVVIRKEYCKPKKSLSQVREVYKQIL